KLNPLPGWRIERESPGTAVIDAEKRLGIVIGSKAMRLAIEKARAVGVGVVTVHNSGHFGAIGHFTLQAPMQDMLSVCLTPPRRRPSPCCPPSHSPPPSAPPPSPPPPLHHPTHRCSSTPPPRPSRGTRSASPCGWARRSSRAGSPTRKAAPSWKRSPYSIGTT